MNRGPDVVLRVQPGDCKEAGDTLNMDVGALVLEDDENDDYISYH